MDAEYGLDDACALQARRRPRRGRFSAQAPRWGTAFVSRASGFLFCLSLEPHVIPQFDL